MIGHLERVLGAKRPEEAWAVHCEALENHGFPKLGYGLTLNATPAGVGPAEDLIILSNHDKGYFDAFIERGYYERAPLTHWAMENAGACSWRLIGELYEQMTPDEREVVDFNRDHGVIAGYSISFHDGNARTRAVMALNARPGVSQDDVDDLWGENGREIRVMCQVFHLKVLAMPQFGRRPKLTARQTEVLEWVADGKTNQDIATIMGLSLATVEKHLRLAREKLDVETTAQAVAKASFHNQMFVL